MDTKNTELGLLDELKNQMRSSILEEFPNIEADLDPERIADVEFNKTDEKPAETTDEKPTETEPKPAEPATTEEKSVAPDEKPVATVAKESKQLDDRVEELIKSEPPGGSHASAKTVASWKEATATLAELKAEKSEYIKKLSEMEAEVKKAKESVEVPEAIKQELEYLRNRVAEVDYSALPEIKEAYDKPLEQATESIIALFKKAEDEKRPRTEGVADRIRETIKEVGIFGVDWDGLLEECAKGRTLTVQERKAIETTLGSALALSQRKESAIKDASNALKEKSEASKAKELEEQQKWNIERQEYLSGLDNSIKEMRGKNPNLNPPVDPGAKATPEQKAEYKKTLEAYAADEAVFFKYANSFLKGKGIGLENSDKIGFITPDEFVSIFEGYVNAKASQKTIDTLNSKVAELTEKLDNYKKGGSTTPTRTSTPAQGASLATTKAPKNAQEARNALREAMQKLSQSEE